MTTARIRSIENRSSSKTKTNRDFLLTRFHMLCAIYIYFNRGTGWSIALPSSVVAVSDYFGLGFSILNWKTL